MSQGILEGRDIPGKKGINEEETGYSLRVYCVINSAKAGEPSQVDGHEHDQHDADPEGRQGDAQGSSSHNYVVNERITFQR